MAVRIKTTYVPGAIAPQEATALYEFLRDSVPWQDGIRSRRENKVTRQAYTMSMESANGDPVQEQVMEIITSVLHQVCPNLNVLPVGAYLNYYRNGDEWAPSHRHPGMVQAVISLGATRKLIVGTKTYSINNGDVIIFGGSSHELVREPEIDQGRISIATFMIAL